MPRNARVVIVGVPQHITARGVVASAGLWVGYALVWGNMPEDFFAGPSTCVSLTLPFVGAIPGAESCWNSFGAQSTFGWGGGIGAWGGTCNGTILGTSW